MTAPPYEIEDESLDRGLIETDAADAASTPTSSWTRSTAAPIALSAAFSLFSAFCFFLLPIHMKEALGFSGAEIGVIFALSSVSTILFAFPIGLGNDLAEPRRMSTASIFLCGISFLGLAGATGFLFFLLFMVIFRLGSHGYRISTDAYVLKGAPETGKRLVFADLYYWRMIATAFGTAAAAFLLRDFPFTTILAGLGVWFLAMTAASRIYLEKMPATQQTMARYWRDLTRPDSLRLALWLFLFTLHWGAEITCYSLFLREGLKLSLPGIGYYMAGEFFIFALACRFFSVWGGKTASSRQMLGWGLAISGLGHVLMTIPNLAASFVFRSIHGVGDAMVTLVMTIGVSEIFGRERMGGNYSAMALVTQVGSFVGALAFSPIGEKFGYQTPLIASGIISALLALALPWIAPASRTNSASRERAEQAGRTGESGINP